MISAALTVGLTAMLGLAVSTEPPPAATATAPAATRQAAMLGKKLTLLDIDPGGWSRPGTSVIVRRVLAKARSGSVVLTHDGGSDRSQTVIALPKILKALKARGSLPYPLWCH